VIDEVAIRTRYGALAAALDERARRLLLGAEALAAGRGGVVDLAGEKVAALIGREPVGLPEDLLEALCGIIASCAAEIGVYEYPDPRRALGL